jgi:tetratricopeptide (TPR) repeat protein
MNKSYVLTDAILVLCKEGQLRDTVRKALTSSNMKISFTSSTQETLDLIPVVKPKFFIHEWSSLEPSQSFSFQHRLSKLEDFQSVLRFILAKDITPQMVALAADCSIKRVLTYANASVSLSEAIQMCVFADKNVSELQSFVHSVKYMGASYDQVVIDSKVEDAYQSYAHDPGVQLEFGNLCLRRAEAQKAETIAKKILDSEPMNVRAMNLLSRIRMKEGKFEEAISILQKANILSPKNPDRLMSLGDAFFKTGNTSAAKAAYGEALSVNPEEKGAQKGLASVAMQEGDLNQAMELLKFSASEEESAGVFNNAAVIAVRDGKYEDAFRLYETAIKTLESTKLKASVFFNLGLAHRKSGDAQGALKAFQRCLRLDPNHEKANRQIKELGV